MSKRSSALVSRVKKLMQEDEDVGKMAQGAPAAVAYATEVLVERLITGASDIAVERSDKILGPGHLKTHVLKEAKMDFLREIVEHAPELPEKKPGAKRERKSRARPSLSEDWDSDEESPSEGKKRGRGRGRGKGRSKEGAGRGGAGRGGKGRGRKKKEDADADADPDAKEPAEKKPKIEDADDVKLGEEDEKLADIVEAPPLQQDGQGVVAEETVKEEGELPEQNVIMTDAQIEAMRAIFEQPHDELEQGQEEEEDYD